MDNGIAGFGGLNYLNNNSSSSSNNNGNNGNNSKKTKNKTSKEEQQRAKLQYKTFLETRYPIKMVVAICLATRDRYECEIPSKHQIERDYGSDAARAKEAIRSMNDYFIFRTYFSKVIPQFNRNEKSHITSDIWACANQDVKDEFKKLEAHLKENFNHKKFVHFTPYSPPPPAANRNARSKSAKAKSQQQQTPQVPVSPLPDLQFSFAATQNNFDEAINTNNSEQLNTPQIIPPIIEIRNADGVLSNQLYPQDSDFLNYQAPDDTAINIPYRDAGAASHSDYSNSSNSRSSSLTNYNYNNSSSCSSLVSSVHSSPATSMLQINCAPYLGSSPGNNYIDAPLTPLSSISSPFQNSLFIDSNNSYPPLFENSNNFEWELINELDINNSGFNNNELNNELNNNIIANGSNSDLQGFLTYDDNNNSSNNNNNNNTSASPSWDISQGFQNIQM